MQREKEMQKIISEIRKMNIDINLLNFNELLNGGSFNNMLWNIDTMSSRTYNSLKIIDKKNNEIMNNYNKLHNEYRIKLNDCEYIKYVDDESMSNSEKNRVNKAISIKNNKIVSERQNIVKEFNEITSPLKNDYTGKLLLLDFYDFSLMPMEIHYSEGKGLDLKSLIENRIIDINIEGNE